MPLNENLCALMRAALPQVELNDEILADFGRLYDRIVETNAAINITAILEECPVVLKHFIDSLSLCQAPEFCRILQENGSVCDIGCGGGFPGLPLAILNRKLRLTMIDSTEKKIAALRESCEILGLSSVTPLWGRGEELCAAKGGESRERFDCGVSRAVARLNVLCELCLPFIRKGGLFIAMKGKNTPEELKEAEKAIPALGGKLLRMQKLAFSEDLNLSSLSEMERAAAEDFFASDRYLVIIRKEKNTAPQYPRKWAQMTKKPL